MENKKFFNALATAAATTDTANDALYGVVLCQVGEAKGHGVLLDSIFIQQAHDSFVALHTVDGLKCRFGHPGMCFDAVGTFIGRFHNPRISEDGSQLLADLYFDPSARISPNGDMVAYVSTLAESDPKAIMSSIVFQCGPSIYKDTEGVEYLDRYDAEGNYIRGLMEYARLDELNACDLVDEGAATEGLFSNTYGVQATKLFSNEPEVLAFLQEHPRAVVLLSKAIPGFKDFYSKYSQAQPVAEPIQPTKIPMKKELSEKAKAQLIKLGRMKFDINATTTDGVDVVVVTSADAPAPGDAVNVVDADGNTTPAPDATHVINGGDFDGYAITTVDGLITEVVAPDAAPAPPATAPTESAMAAELSAVKAEFKAFKAAMAKFTNEPPLDKGADGDGLEAPKAELDPVSEQGRRFYESARRRAGK